MAFWNPNVLMLHSGVFDFVEGLASLLELFVHGKQVLDAGVLAGVLPNEVDDVFDGDFPRPANLHRLHSLKKKKKNQKQNEKLIFRSRVKMRLTRKVFSHHFRDVLHDQVFQEVDRLSVRVLIVTEAVHHATEFFGEQASAFVSGVIRRCRGWLLSRLILQLQRKKWVAQHVKRARHEKLVHTKGQGKEKLSSYGWGILNPLDTILSPSFRELLCPSI